MEAMIEQIGGYAPPAIAPQATTDTKVVEMWLFGRSAHTQRAYKRTSADFFAYVQKPLRAVTLDDLQSYANTLTHLKTSSKNRVLGAIRSLFSFAHKLGYLAFNVGAVLKLEKVKDHLSERIISECEVQKMIVLETNPRNRTILRLLYNSGCRVSELCGLRWKNVQEHGECGVITVFGKGGKTRTIKLRAAVWVELEQLRPERVKADGPVFESRKHSPLSVSQVWRIVHAAAERAGIEKAVSPHWMRHAHASHALDRRAPVHVVQATLGHASLATTSRYVHVRPNESSGDYLAG